MPLQTVQPARNRPDHPMSVLLVEDDPEYARLVERALLPAGSTVQIEHVTSLGAALVEQQRNPADVVLLDLGLPDSSPAQTTISAARLRRGVPVFVLTSRDDRATVIEALGAGVEDYLIKDQLDPSTLATVLRAAVVRRKAGQMDAFCGCVGPDELRVELRRRIAALEADVPLNVTVLELDYFDTLRATWGEPWAHRMLRSASDSLLAGATETTLIARLNDGVFAVVDAGRERSPALCQASIANDMTFSPDVSHRERYSVTASLGTSIAPDDGTHPATLLERAHERARRAFRSSQDGLRFRLGAESVS